MKAMIKFLIDPDTLVVICVIAVLLLGVDALLDAYSAAKGIAP